MTRMRELFAGPSASTEALWQKILAQDRLNDEHLDKTGKYASDTELANNTWFGMTDELAKDAARDSSGIDETASYKDVKKFVQDSREFDRRFKKKSLDKDVEMGIASASGTYPRSGCRGPSGCCSESGKVQHWLVRRKFSRVERPRCSQ